MCQEMMENEYDFEIVFNNMSRLSVLSLVIIKSRAYFGASSWISVLYYSTYSVRTYSVCNVLSVMDDCFYF